VQNTHIVRNEKTKKQLQKANKKKTKTNKIRKINISFIKIFSSSFITSPLPSSLISCSEKKKIKGNNLQIKINKTIKQ